MGLLDRFRTARPAWEHPDPAQRAEGVRGLRGSDVELLTSILKNDPDAPVRKVALRKLEDVALLSEVAQADADASVREEAADALLKLALDGREEQQALRAAETVSDA